MAGARLLRRAPARQASPSLTTFGQLARRGPASEADVMRNSEADNRRHAERTGRVVLCVECGSSSWLRWKGRGAYRCEDSETNEPPEIAFYCPSCAEHEFGHSRRAS